MTEENLRPVCADIAAELMHGCTAPVDWSAWIVDVHDAYGQHVMTFSFAEIANEIGCLSALAA